MLRIRYVFDVSQKWTNCVKKLVSIFCHTFYQRSDYQITFWSQPTHELNQKTSSVGAEPPPKNSSKSSRVTPRVTPDHFSIWFSSIILLSIFQELLSGKFVVLFDVLKKWNNWENNFIVLSVKISLKRRLLWTRKYRVNPSSRISAVKPARSINLKRRY